ncbi:carboxylesterase family protein, partial [Streptosporangium algeriense]
MIVNTRYGAVEGLTEGDVTAFRGVPFAASPVGGLRWRPPVP